LRLPSVKNGEIPKKNEEIEKVLEKKFGAKTNGTTIAGEFVVL